MRTYYSAGDIYFWVHMAAYLLLVGVLFFARGRAFATFSSFWRIQLIHFEMYATKQQKKALTTTLRLHTPAAQQQQHAATAADLHMMTEFQGSRIQRQVVR